MRPRLLLAPAATAVAAGAGAWALHVRDPHESGTWGACPFLAVTGLPCAGCGGLRAVHDLTDGDVAGALASNALVVVGVVLAAVLWLRWTARRAAGVGAPAVTLSRTGAWVALGVVAAFGVVRLAPWGAGLGP